MDELLARVRAAVRRAVADQPPARRSTPTPSPSTSPPPGVRRDGEEVRLTPTEWRLLEALVSRPGRLVSQRQLLREVWGPGVRAETNYLRVYLAELRRKLEADPRAPAPDHRARHGVPVPPLIAVSLSAVARGCDGRHRTPGRRTVTVPTHTVGDRRTC